MSAVPEQRLGGEGESVGADLPRRVRMAGRALDRAGLVHAYGHCSARIDSERFIVTPLRPLGLLEPGEPCIEVAIDRPLSQKVGGEVRLHQAIYRRRSDVGGICRAQPPNTMVLSSARITPRARHGFSSYFAPQPALWDDPALVRDDAAASGVAEALGAGSAVVLRGNGAVTAGATIEGATVLCWYLEDSARVELELRKIADVNLSLSELSEGEAKRRATWEGAILERMWAYLVQGDPELDSTA